MKIRFQILLFLLLFFLTTGVNSLGQTRHYFNYGQTLRIDFVLSGDHEQQQSAIAAYKKSPGYSSCQNQNIPSFDYGTYRLVLLNPQTEDTLFLKGFCTLFEEWRTTEQAGKVSRAFEQTVEAPWPMSQVRILIEYRKKDRQFVTLINELFSPEETIPVTQIIPSDNPTDIIHGVNNPCEQADLLILSEGYTKAEKESFLHDAKNITEYLFSIAPYTSLKDKITVRALHIPSPQAGTDDPDRNIWKKTAMNSSFNTFGSDRYLESFSTWTIFDYAAGVPHDHIIVLVNTSKYGGGGVYNHFSIVSARHPSSPKVFVHEIGHGLTGLGDEYYYNDSFTPDFFDKKSEPWIPNLTTLVNFDIKWKHLVPDTVPIPTPPTTKYKNVTGVFEGGGYSAKGIYRPALNCRMKSNDADEFCEVCRYSIKKIINFYTQ
jgi:hypothetical protein